MSVRKVSITVTSVFMMMLGLHALPTYAATRVVLYGDANYPPYSFVKNGQFQGMYVDILQKAAVLLKPSYEVQLIPVPWKRGLMYMEKGYGIGLFPPGLKKERTYIQPYSVPIYTEEVVVFCNDNVIKAKRKVFPDDFAGLTMGVNAGFLLSDRLMRASNSGIIKLEAAPSNESNLKKLALKRIDCYVSDRAAALYSAKQLRNAGDLIDFTPTETVTLSGENTFIGYSTKSNPPFKADFIKKMDAALETLKNKNEIKVIIKHYTQ